MRARSFLTVKNFSLLKRPEAFRHGDSGSAKKIWLATDPGICFSVARNTDDSTFSAVKIPAETLQNSKGLPLEITSLAELDNRIIAGTRSRSFIAVDGDRTFEFSAARDRFFVNALVKDNSGTIWLGADSEATGSGLFTIRDAGRPDRIGSNIGT